MTAEEVHYGGWPQHILDRENEYLDTLLDRNGKRLVLVLLPLPLLTLLVLLRGGGGGVKIKQGFKLFCGGG